MEIELVDLIENPENIDKITTIKTEYSFFKDNETFLEKNLGKRAKGFFFEESAYLIFEDNPNILVLIKKAQFNKEDFCLKNIEIEIYGKSGRKIPTFRRLLKEDLMTYKIGILGLILLYIIIFCTSETSIGLKNLNNIFVDIISIFIGMLFVFAIMFYGENEVDEAIKNGKAQENFFIDKYIFVLAMVSLVFVIVSNGILDYEISNSNVIVVRDYVKQNFYYIYWIIKYGFAELLTGIAIICNYICFQSIIDYYLNKIKSKSINKEIRTLRDTITNKKERL